MQTASEQGKVFAVTKMNPHTKSIVPALLRALSVVVVFFGALFSWLLKDGLGPDSISSSGYVGFLRFLDGFWPFGVAAIIFFVISFLVPRTYKRHA